MEGTAQAGKAIARSHWRVALDLDEFNKALSEVIHPKDPDRWASHSEVANLLGCGIGTVSRLRNGEQNPGLATVIAFAVRAPKIPLRRVFRFAHGKDVAA